MQEDIERRAVALSVKTGKLTAQTLAKVLALALRRFHMSQGDGSSTHCTR